MLSTIILGALSGALAGVITGLITRRLPRAKPHYRVIFAVLLAALYAVTSVTIGPALRVRDVRSQAERAFEAESTFRLLAQEHPDLKAHFIEFVVDLERQGASREEAYARGIEWGRAQMTPYLLRYVARTSDSAALSFLTVLTDALKTLQSEDPSACVDYLFGPAPGTPPHLPRFSPDRQTAISQALDAVVITAIRAPHPSVDSATGNALLQLLVSHIQETYGADVLRDVAALGDPTKVRRDPARSCNAAYVLYSTALRLPPDQAGPLFRFMTSLVKN